MKESVLSYLKKAIENKNFYEAGFFAFTFLAIAFAVAGNIDYLIFLASSLILSVVIANEILPRWEHG